MSSDSLFVQAVRAIGRGYRAAQVDPKVLFDKRIEKVREVLRSHELDTDINILASAQRFAEDIGFPYGDLTSERMVFHDGAHVAGCATSGRAAHEGIARVFENVFYREASARVVDEDVYADPVKADLSSAAASSFSVVFNVNHYYEATSVPSLDIALCGIANYIDEGKKYLERHLTHIRKKIDDDDKKRKQGLSDKFLLSSQEREGLLQNIRVFEDRKNADIVSEQDASDAYESAIRQEAFFRALTNGRPAYAFSVKSFSSLPLTFLGVQRADASSGQLFEPIEPEICESIVRELS